MRADELVDGLAVLEAHHCRRRRNTLYSPQRSNVVMTGKHYLTFASNDYLGLAAHPELIRALQLAAARWGVGAGASPLVSGHFSVHDELERALARFVGCDDALLFSSGYAANQAIVTSFVTSGDAVFVDRLNHASLHDACRQSRAAFHRFRHNDLNHLEQLLASTPAHTKLIAIEAVYSMDGDEAPLADLLALAHRYDAWLYIDDAHGFGVLGNAHGSLCESGINSERVLYMATLGKAAGVVGAFIAGSGAGIDWLINTARSYIYHTALPPALAATVLTSIRLMQTEGWRHQHLWSLVQRFTAKAYALGVTLMPSRTPIQPVLIGDNARTVTVSELLKDHGILVAAIRPPSVPNGAARLRITLTAGHTVSDIDTLLDVLVRVLSVTTPLPHRTQQAL